MNKKTSEKIKVGIFVITAAALLIVGIYMIGNKQTLFGNSFELLTVFRNVNGLQIGNNVRYSGINVGTVGEIDMLNDTSIQVTMRIQSKIQRHIKTDAIATVSSDGLVGSMFVNIIPGNGSEKTVESGDKIQSFSKIGTDDMLSTLNVTNENAALLTADLLKITEAIIKGQGTLGMLLKDSVIANDLKATVANLKKTSNETITLMKKVNNVVEEFTQDNSIASLLLKDSTQAEVLKKVIDNLAEVSDGVLVTVDNLNTLMEDIKTGEGTLTAMLYDSAMANDLKSAMHNLERSTILLNEDLEALKHSFPLKGYYKKEAKRQAKEDKKKAKED